MTINVHIERLVLDDPASSGDVRGVRRSLQHELTRLLREGGLSRELQDGAAVPSVRAGSIGSADRAKTPLGSRVARAVYDGIGARTP
jgi:hypothetical protein